MERKRKRQAGRTGERQEGHHDEKGGAQCLRGRYIPNYYQPMDYSYSAVGEGGQTILILLFLFLSLGSLEWWW